MYFSKSFLIDTKCIQTSSTNIYCLLNAICEFNIMRYSKNCLYWAPSGTEYLTNIHKLVN